MDILKKAAELNEHSRPFMLATVTAVSGSSPAKPGFRMIAAGSGELFGTIGGGSLEKIIADEAAAVLSSGKQPGPEHRKMNLSSLNMECGGSVDLFIEYFGGRRNFILFGGGHVGRALAEVLELLDFSVTIFDNREEIRPEASKGTRSVIISDYSDISAVSGSLHRSLGCFIATQGHEWDRVVLSQVIKTAPELNYIGMIGSKRKVRTILDSIRSEGLQLPAGLYTPVGLKIGGDSAAEIAVSVAAEIIAVYTETPSNHMRSGLDG